MYIMFCYVLRMLAYDYTVKYRTPVWNYNVLAFCAQSVGILNASSHNFLQAVSCHSLKFICNC